MTSGYTLFEVFYLRIAYKEYFFSFLTSRFPSIIVTSEE